MVAGQAKRGKVTDGGGNRPKCDAVPPEPTRVVVLPYAREMVLSTCNEAVAIIHNPHVFAHQGCDTGKDREMWDLEAGRNW